MQRNAYKKAIGERIQQLRKGLRKEGFNGQPKTVNEFLEFLNPKIDDDYDNYGDYSLTDIEFSYKRIMSVRLNTESFFRPLIFYFSFICVLMFL